MTKIHDLAALGQSIWYDNISREILDSGEMQRLIDLGVVGVTSNPSIFKKAIADSGAYDEAIRSATREGLSVPAIYEALALADIGRAADLFRPVYETSDGLDGYVSLEVNPDLAHDTVATVAEARRLFQALDRPNIMIKVPATPAGVPAFEELIGAGININVTLMFSLAHYEAIANAYVRGVRQLAAQGGDVSRIASVASFFVSRIDTKVDAALEAAGETALQGQIAIANARLAYARFQEIFSGPAWTALAAQGARVQRPLWASTSTKNPAYSPTMYVDTLIGPHTVNTLPPQTVDAFLEDGAVAETVNRNYDQARSQIGMLAAVGVDFAAITQSLQVEGVDAFAAAYHDLLAAVEDRSQALAPA